METEEAAHRYTEEREETETGDEEWQQATARVWSAQEARREKTALRDRELEILRRERELMQRELTLLRREANTEPDAQLTALPSTASQSSTTRMQPKALSELLNEFSGLEDTFWTW